VPHLKGLLEKHKDAGLVVIAVHSDPDEAKMRDAVKELGITWPVVQDGDRAIMKAFHADSFPDYYLIDRKGTLRFADLANIEVDRAVEFLLKEK
jgi:peroxiredoxin